MLLLSSSSPVIAGMWTSAIKQAVSKRGDRGNRPPTGKPRRRRPVIANREMSPSPSWLFDLQLGILARTTFQANSLGPGYRTTAAGLGDTFATPFDRVAPGAEIFATAISNLLTGDTLARTPSTRGIDAAMAAGLPVAMIALMAMRRAAVGLAIAALVFVLWAAGVFLAFLNGYWLSVALPLATSVPLLVGYTAARFLGRASSGTKNSRGKGDAGQVSVAASGRSPPP